MDELTAGALELDPDGLKAVEFQQATIFVEAIVGKTIASATIGAERTSISTTDGTTIEFCGFGGVAPGRGQS